MPLLGTQPHEDLAGHEVGDRPARGAEHRGHVVTGLHGGAGPCGQDQRGAPAAGPLDDRLEHVAARRPGVLEGQPRGLLPAEPEHVAAQHGQVAQELGDEPGDGQVPPGQEQDAEPLGVGVEPVRDQAHAGGREEVRVVDDQQPRGSSRVAGGPREDVLDIRDRAGGRGGVPDRIGEGWSWRATRRRPGSSPLRRVRPARSRRPRWRHRGGPTARGGGRRGGAATERRGPGAPGGPESSGHGRPRRGRTLRCPSGRGGVLDLSCLGCRHVLSLTTTGPRMCPPPSPSRRPRALFTPM